MICSASSGDTRATKTQARIRFGERLARGELSAGEDEALRARAAADPEAATLYEAYRPLSGEVTARLVERATEALAAPEKIGRGRVLPWRRVALAVAGPLAAAAALALVLHRPVEPAASPLPAYALAVTGGTGPRDRARTKGRASRAPSRFMPGRGSRSCCGRRPRSRARSR